MTDFFIKTDKTVAGPFTGVEIREAALARIVLPGTGIGASPQGPWTRASEAGLFSDKNIPLPHPADTHIPQFRLSGVSEAFQGSFKLRELIGFAARRMLPMDALIQSDVHSDWVPVTRIGILNACFTGTLVPAGARSDVSSQGDITRVDGPHATDERWKGKRTTQPIGTTSPSETIASTSSIASEAAAQDTSDVKADVETEVDATESVVDATESNGPQPSLADYNQEWRTSLRKGWRIPLPTLRPRYFGCFVAISLVAACWFLWVRAGMTRGELVGDWMHVVAAGDRSGGPSFGISFRENGDCVLFNTRGESWSGEFQWMDLPFDTVGFRSLAPMSTEIAEVDSSHQRAVVRSSDGYIRFSGGLSKEAPRIGNQRVRECYVRREGKNLRIGYLATVNWTASKKTMEAGWILVTPAKSQSNRMAELNASDAVNGSGLLAAYGLPDEARPLHRFEQADLAGSETLGGLQLVRYGSRKIVLTAEGEVHNAAQPNAAQPNATESNAAESNATLLEGSGNVEDITPAAPPPRTES